MSFIVETGAGTPNANAYDAPAFVTAYLTDRNRETENSWSTSRTTRQQQACVVATDYIDKRWGGRFKGVRFRYLISGRQADGTLTLTVAPSDTEVVVLGQKTYRFVVTLAQENDVLIGATAAESATNLAAAINGTDDSTIVHEDTLPNYEASAAVSSAVLTLTALQKGENGNLVALSTTVTGATATGSGFLAGGLDDAPQPLEFPRAGCTDRDGRVVVGVPLGLRQAMAEYAVRSLAATLAPDPTTNVSGTVVKRSKRVIGPIESETEYADGATIRIYKPYPSADRLLAPLVHPFGTSR